MINRTRAAGLIAFIGAVAFAASPPAKCVAKDDIPPVQAIAVGDFNGDGTPDIAVGLPDVQHGKLREAGQVRVFSGKKGTLLWKIGGSAAEEGYSDAVCSVGDVDGDGCTDLAIGTEFAEPNCRLDIVSGKTGKVLRFQDAPGPVGLGSKVCAMGDGSGKAVVDVLVWASFAKHWTVVAPASAGNIGSVKDPGMYTAEASCVGDVDGDGQADVAICDFAEEADGKASAGRIRVLSGALLRKADSNPEILMLRGKAALESLGLEVAAAGDWNGDGKGDLLSGTSGGADAKAGWSLRVLSGTDGAELWKAAGEKGDYAIGGVAMVGDVDGDGKRDVAVGSPGRKARAGAVSVLSAADGKVLWSVAGSAGNEKLGDQVLAIADADGDGFGDLCVVAPSRGPGYVRFLSGKTGKLITNFNPL